MKIKNIEKKNDKGRITVIGIMEDGTEKRLFNYYSDELTFTSDELVGLTMKEAVACYLEKDKAYIQS